ncbi:MAG: transglycosylase-associated protein [Myxococcales bacterium]|nr:transglycosylase-associated protein [Myxococcales bacterium]
MLTTILIGFFSGLFARWVKPGAQRLGWIMTSLVGIGGAVLATFIGQALGWYEHGDRAGFLASVGGAVVLLILYEAIKPRPAPATLIAPSDGARR